MTLREKTVREFIGYYNQRDALSCATLVTDDIEFRSTYIKHLFPKTSGILNGKVAFIQYLDLLFENMPDLEAGEIDLKDNGEFIIVSAYNLQETISYYLHYYVNEAGLLYLIKSNLTRPQ